MAKDASAPTIEKEKGTWLGFFIKLFFVLLVIMTVGIMVLSTLGGKSDVLKGSIEDFLSQRFGGRAEIDTFNQMTFYPYLSIDMAGVRVFDGASESRTKFSADKVVMAMGFWDVALSSGKVKTFDVENLKAAPGTIIAQGLTIDSAAIIDEGDQAYIRSSGKVGTTPYNFEAHVETTGKGKRKKYSFGDVRPFDANFGDIKVKGVIEDMDVDTMTINNFSLGDTSPLLVGDLDVYYGGQNRFKVKGDIGYGQASKANVDILIESETGTKISGDANFSEMLLSDALDYGRTLELLDKIKTILGKEKKKTAGYDLSGIEMEVNVSVDKLIHNNVTLASLQYPVKLAGGDLHVGPITSGFQGADLNSDIYFITSEKPAQFKQHLVLKNWDYGPIQKAYNNQQNVTGRADIKIDVKSEGNSLDELKAGLNGNVSFIAGKAEFPAATLNFWGKGLLNALLPDMSPQAQTTMNCGIADFSIENGVAESNALFLDTMEVTLRGEGEYDIAKDNLDIDLQPEPKSVAIGDIATEVNIDGPLGNPSIGPSAFGIGKKLGGLALGLINPAFLAYSLTDLGLNDDHPCAEFIGDEKKAAE